MIEYQIQHYTTEMGWEDWPGGEGTDGPGQCAHWFEAADELVHLRRKYGGKWRIVEWRADPDGQLQLIVHEGHVNDL